MPPSPLNSFFGMCNRINVLLICNCSSVYQENNLYNWVNDYYSLIVLDAKKNISVLTNNFTWNIKQTHVFTYNRYKYWYFTSSVLVFFDKKIKLRMTNDIRDIGFGTWNSRTHWKLRITYSLLSSECVANLKIWTQLLKWKFTFQETKTSISILLIF